MRRSGWSRALWRGLLYGLVAVGAVSATGVLAPVYGFVTGAGGAFNPFGVIAFSAIFSGATMAVTQMVTGNNTAPAGTAPAVRSRDEAVKPALSPDVLADRAPEASKHADRVLRERERAVAQGASIY